MIVPSARKHQISDDDMLHAYRHPIRVFDLDDLTMLIGADTAQLGTEFTVLLNTYQTLLAAFSKMQSISILNYLS